MIKLKKSKFAFMLCILLCCCMVFGGTAFAAPARSVQGDNYVIDPQLETAAYTEMRALNKTGALQNPVLLYNLNNEVECVCYSISSGGFIIMNVKDYGMKEFSPTGTSEVHDFMMKRNAATRFYYNGPMNIFYDAGSGKVSEIHTDETFNRAQFTTRYSAARKAYNPIQTRIVVDGGYKCQPTQAWSNYSPGGTHYMCVPIATAIILEYYQRYFTYNKYTYFPSGTSWTSRNTVCSLLTGGNKPYSGDNPFVTNHENGMNVVDIAPESHRDYTDSAGFYHKYDCQGMQAYFSTYVTAPYSFNAVSTFNYDSICARLKVEKPAMMCILYGLPELGTAVPQNGSHMVVATGYRTNVVGDKQFFINDGWGHTERIVTLNTPSMSWWYYIQ